MIEYELTYLAKALPPDLAAHQPTEYIDLYFPASDPHPVLRLRRRGDRFEITKKTIISGTDSSEMNEATIELTSAEYEALAAAPGKKVHKLRYDYQIANSHAEIDVFQGELAGLVLIDFEFTSSEAKATFTMPDICLADVTQEAFIAGGKLAGANYADITDDLQAFGYQKLVAKNG
jgi:CYTH domain-containing protein